MNMFEYEEIFRLHETLWSKFKETSDIEYFKAARACARKIMDYEERMSAYRHHFLLNKMYGDKE